MILSHHAAAVLMSLRLGFRQSDAIAAGVGDSAVGAVDAELDRLRVAGLVRPVTALCVGWWQLTAEGALWCRDQGLVVSYRAVSLRDAEDLRASRALG